MMPVPDQDDRIGIDIRKAQERIADKQGEPLPSLEFSDKVTEWAPVEAPEQGAEVEEDEHEEGPKGTITAARKYLRLIDEGAKLAFKNGRKPFIRRVIYFQPRTRKRANE